MSRRHQQRTVARSRRELEEKLRDRYQMLLSANKSYDAGETFQVPTMATHIRVLLHAGQGRALLYSLDIQKKMRFVDTSYRAPAPDLFCPYPPGLAGTFVKTNGRGGSASISLSLDTNGWTPTLDTDDGGEAGFAAPLDDLIPMRMHPPAKFNPWWNTRFICGDGQALYSRSQVVLGIANHDGAHVDPAPGADYVQLRSTVGGVRYSGKMSRSLLEATMRQISHEMVSTLRRDPWTATVVGG